MSSSIKPLDKDKTNILFIHHSTGGNLLKEGKVRELLYSKTKDVDLWDHGYNLYPVLPSLLGRFTFHTGLSDPEGHITGQDYNIIISNNSPKEYAEIFSRDPLNSTLAKILQYDVIIFKNCFPTTKIDSDKKLEDHMHYYTEIKKSILKYPNKLFIVFTPPPLRREVTQTVYANRARKLADWMISKEYIGDISNLRVFNFFDLLSSNEGENKDMLKREYLRWSLRDSHPNTIANKQIAPVFVDYVVASISNFSFRQK